MNISVQIVLNTTVQSNRVVLALLYVEKKNLSVLVGRNVCKYSTTEREQIKSVFEQIY